MKQTIEINQEELEEFVKEKLSKCGVRIVTGEGWLVWRTNGGHLDNLTATVEAEMSPVAQVPEAAPTRRNVHHEQISLPVVPAASRSLDNIPLDPNMFPDPEAAALLLAQTRRMRVDVEGEDGTIYPGETPNRTQEAHSMADLVKGWPPRGAGR